MPLMQSSHDCSVEFRVNGTTNMAPLPLAVAPLSVEPRITLQSARFAFLAPPAPVRKDTLIAAQRDELCEWLTNHRRDLREGTIIITEVVRSSGWVGGVALGRKTEVSVNAATGSASVSATAGYSVSQMAPIRGPDDWSLTDSAGYTLIVNYVAARTRIQRLLQKAKIALYSTAAHSRGAEVKNNNIGRSGSSITDYEPSSNLIDTTPEVSNQVPLDECEVVGGNDGEEPDVSLLTSILDKVLDENPDIDIAVGDWSCISAFVTRLPKVALSNRSTMNVVFTKRTVPSTSETAAIVLSISSRYAPPKSETSESARNTKLIRPPDLVLESPPESEPLHPPRDGSNVPSRTGSLPTHSIPRQGTSNAPARSLSEKWWASTPLSGYVQALCNAIQRRGEAYRWDESVEKIRGGELWTCRICIEDVEYAVGYGPTKQVARERAAAAALDAL
ncbi:hypothetical protein EXIGLDRAFT_753880 [Exidia glandulosa HHB12029]|uniref:DRBM domain-containing protein n=1 Tax=Exidia glandulosa HHB12029 TaxID=1314781 RepID=A0A165DF17_EXIGL|nr:hypothetical protein EXIGLDRAFT_753880 [Exidia glandulosa HHB12029]